LLSLTLLPRGVVLVTIAPGNLFSPSGRIFQPAKPDDEKGFS